jgi:hypothetical protein
MTKYAFMNHYYKMVGRLTDKRNKLESNPEKNKEKISDINVELDLLQRELWYYELYEK